MFKSFLEWLISIRPILLWLIFIVLIELCIRLWHNKKENDHG